MKRWALVVVLLFSVGINVGILATLAVHRSARSQDPAIEASPPVGPPRVQPNQEIQQPRPPMPHLERMADHFELQGEDRERFLEIQKTFFQEVAQQRRKMEEARRALKHELVSEAPDRSRAEELMERSAAAHAALERALVTNVLDSREILRPDQERRFAIFIERIAKGPVEKGTPPNVGPFRRGERPFRPQDRFQGRQPNRQQDRPQGQQDGARRDPP